MKLVKKILKWTGITLVSLLLILTIVILSRQHLHYDAPYPQVHASTDSMVIAQGAYLFYGPAHCMDCHSNRADYPGLAEGKPVPPSGGVKFELPVGVMHTPNITSDDETGIGKLTDGEIARTLRYGVGSDGRAVLDFMPFHNTSDEDLTAIISFLRTIPPVKKEQQRMQYNLLGAIVKAFILKPVGPTEEVPKTVQRGVTVEYGKYLANSVANCRGCHTNRDLMTGEFTGEDFSGGFKMDIPGKPGMFVVSRNLTPDQSTGHIYNWSEQQFINRFRAGKLIPDSPMPWEPFQQLSDNDLRAIYKYLHTIKPVKNHAGPVLITQK